MKIRKLGTEINRGKGTIERENENEIEKREEII
jgi:hypothetical protein